VDDKLAFLKTEGKNTNIFIVDPAAGEDEDMVRALRPVAASPASEAVERSAIRVADRSASLWTPKGDKTGNLFVWLHGGPMRQTSVGYHPYLSYAVYDELLERLAEGGNYVLRLDYAGSTGYGSAFQNSLKGQVGVADIADVKNAIDEMQEQYDIDRVYLIGNSYGGYLALKGIVDDPQAVDGAISINGVSDWYSLISRIPSSPFSALFDGQLTLANASNYMNASTYKGLTALDQDQKILVVYGEQDATVPVWQSTNYLAYAAANQTVKADIEGLSFATEDHILRARSTLDALCAKVTNFFGLKNVSCKEN
jgi:dipeptidyl aminopeptidase/acylaminoacyl peptidase